MNKFRLPDDFLTVLRAVNIDPVFLFPKGGLLKAWLQMDGEALTVPEASFDAATRVKQSTSCRDPLQRPQNMSTAGGASAMEGGKERDCKKWCVAKVPLGNFYQGRNLWKVAEAKVWSILVNSRTCFMCVVIVLLPFPARKNRTSGDRPKG
jgi:hypothetical protein